jgi:hypothetical protein
MEPILGVQSRLTAIMLDYTLTGFNQYKPKGGSDAASWLELHRAGTIIVDRKTGIPRTIYVPRAAVSVCGTVQPGTLRRRLTREFFEAGLPARRCWPRRRNGGNAGRTPTCRPTAQRGARRCIGRPNGRRFATYQENRHLRCTGGHCSA